MVSILTAENVRANLHIRGNPQELTGTFEEVGRHAMDTIIQKNLHVGEYKIEILEPTSWAKLTDTDIEFLVNQYREQIPGRVFLAIELGLATFEQLGIKPILNKTIKKVKPFE